MNNLGRIVLLVGPNGSGKTRVLRAIQQSCYQWKRLRNTSEILRELRVAENNLKNCLYGDDDPSGDLAVHYHGVVEKLKSELTATPWAEFEGQHLQAVDDPTVVSFQSESTDLGDWKSLSHMQSREALNDLSRTLQLGGISNSVVPAIQEAGAIHFGAKEAGDELDLADVRRNAAERWERLVASIRHFLETDLGWDVADRGPTLYGKPIAQAELSHGQKKLLALATALALQNVKTDNLLIAIDEPENHLHPNAVITLLSAIGEKCPKAQIWIATHSIHVIAHFGTESIWSVKNGQVARAGKGWHEVLESLLGGEEQIKKTRELLAMPEAAAMLSFATQCLIAPGVADWKDGDPQNRQICELLKSSPTRQLRVVDYGAGKGRLLEELQSQFHPLSQYIDYYAVDKKSLVDLSTQTICLEKLAACYANGNERYLIEPGALRKSLDKQSVNKIILCNVLHEVPPDDWVQLMGESSEFAHCLADDGELLIVEDQLLKDGERAHRYGFLVLDEYELKGLFGVDTQSKEIVTVDHPNQRYKGRLKAHLIPKKLLKNVSYGTVTEALERLKQTAQEKAEEILSSPSSTAEVGRRYAFWTAQHFNATIALSKRKSNPSA